MSSPNNLLGNFKIPMTRTPMKSRIYYYIEPTERSICPGTTIDIGNHTQVTSGSSNKIAILYLIDKYRPETLPKFEDLVHLYVTLDEPQTWHGEQGTIFSAAPIGLTVTVDIRWIMQLETWYVLSRPENFAYHFKRKLDSENFKFIQEKIKDIVDHFWAGDVFEDAVYGLGLKNLREVVAGPLNTKYQMVLARQIQILTDTGQSGEQWL